MTTLRPQFRLTYEGVDITADIRDIVLSVQFVDKLEGESDTLKVSTQNIDLRWLDAWLPGEGDTVQLEIGYEGEALLGPITFEVNMPSWQGPPDTFTLQGTSIPISKSLRQRNSQAYERTTLQTIAQTIASKHGLTVVGDIPAISFKRVTQKEQTDLEFLRDLAKEYGTVFKIESTNRLVFYQESSLEAQEPVQTIQRSQVSKYGIRRRAAGTYKAATVSYQDSESGDFIEVTIDTAGANITPSEDEEGTIASDDILKVRTRCEDRAQAEIKAKEALRRANSQRVELDLELMGDPLLSSGTVMALSGFARFDGNYLINEVTHTINRNRGYVNLLKARKV